MIELRSGACLLRIAPELGGAVLAFEAGGVPLFHPVVDPKLAEQRGEAIAAYPLVPFSNRVAWGRFSFGGETFQLARNFGDDPHTIHGNAWMHPWRVLVRDDRHARLGFDHDPSAGRVHEWPFRYHTEIDYALRTDGVDVTMTVTNTDGRPQPVGFGFHPYFPRDPETALCFAARTVWRTDPDELPAERLPVEGDWSFDPIRRVDGKPIDNCFNGWFGCAAIAWPARGIGLEACATPPFGHLVVYTPDGKPYLAFEPASNMTDAINRLEEPDNGLRVLLSGETLSGRVTYNVTDASR